MIPARVPSQRYVRGFTCPDCGALPYEPCRDRVNEAGWRPPRSHNHARRVEAAQAWLGRQLQLPDA